MSLNSWINEESVCPTSWLSCLKSTAAHDFQLQSVLTTWSIFINRFQQVWRMSDSSFFYLLAIFRIVPCLADGRVGARPFFDAESLSTSTPVCLPGAAPSRSSGSSAEGGEKLKVVVVPVPVPVFIPVPMNMYSQHTPVPVTMPVPVGCTWDTLIDVVSFRL